MRDKLRTLLENESGKKSVSMFLTQSVFLGIFIGAFDITAHSLLLSTFDEKMMARGYVASGIIGIILTLFCSRLRRKVEFRIFALINLIVVSAITLFLCSALIFSEANWIILIVFIMLGPLNILVLLGFWGTADRLYSQRQGKRLFRNADTGLIIGIIIVSFTIPLLLIFKLQSQNILLISAASAIVATIIQSLISTELSQVAADEKLHSEKPALFVALREDPYVRSIAIFAALSVLTLFFIQYSFMAVTREQFPVAGDMAAFLGLFTGIMMILILFVKLYVFTYLLHNQNFLTCLLISPVLIAVLSIIAVSIGLLIGYTPEATSGFILFFLLLAVSRLISRSLKEQVEFPSLKVIYQSIDKKLRPELQSGMVGIVNEVAVLFSGLVLTCLGLFSFFKLIHFSILLFIIAIMWIIVGFRLFKKYKNTIIKITGEEDQVASVVDIPDKCSNLKNRFSAYINFKDDYFSLISGDYSVLNKSSNKWYFEKIIDYAYSKKDINLLAALKKTANNASLDDGVRQRSAEVVRILQKNSTSPKADNEMISAAIKSLSGSRMPQTTEILRLLRDNSIESKRLAIYMIGKFRLTDLLSEVCRCLSISGLAKDAFEVLKTFGPGTEKELINLYLITSGNIRLSRIILQLLGKTCTTKAMGFLFSRLLSNSRPLKEIAAKCLIDCKFKPSEEEKQQLHKLTSEVVGSITWYLSAKISLERDGDKFFLEKINREINRWNKFLFNILSITYNPGSISRIWENIENESIESVTYALEMTGIVVSDSIKPQLIYLLDVVPDEDKIMNLFQFFPGEIPGHKKLLEDIINRDYNLISLWTKACALRSISSVECNNMAESVTALLFSPEELIQEESANLIARSRPELYKSASRRISESIKMRLDNIVNGTADKKELLFEKVEFLSRYFGGISEDELLSLAREMKHIKDFDGEYFASSGDYIIWTLYGDEKQNEVHVVYSGESDRLTLKYQEEQHISFYYLPLNAVEEFHFQFPDKSFEILKYIDDHEE
jgi:ATP/ADP translocase